MKKMNHLEYPKKLKKLCDLALRFIIADCQEAIKAMPDNENCSFYADEICYCTTELFDRKMKGVK